MSVKNSEKKKVALKLRISNQKDLPGNKVEPQMITEWNYKRIFIALIIVLILIAVSLSLLWNKDVPEITENNSQIKQTSTNINSPAKKVGVLKEKTPVTPSVQADKSPTPTQTSGQSIGSVVRAQLANGIWQNEPFSKITESIKVNSEEATGIYYFTELKNLKDKAIFHIWKYRGEVIFKIKKDVLKDPWKTYSSKLFTKRSIGPWSVEAVDSNNRQLNVINFEVVAAVD